MWADVLATWYTDLEGLFTTPAMSTTPHYQYGITFDRKMILPHGTANLVNLGLAMNIGISSWYYTGGYRRDRRRIERSLSSTRRRPERRPGRHR